MNSRFFILVILLSISVISCSTKSKSVQTSKSTNMEFYNLKVNDPNGEELRMSDYQGKVVLIVNTATKCGFAPQFEGLEDLHQKYKDQGLAVIGFPCNQFRNQEPESNETMIQACQRDFGVSFQLTEKIDVNGTGTHPIFVFLKNELGGLLGKKIKWNFTKFLIDRQGKPIKRYAPTTKPQSIEKDIKKLLKL